MNTLKQFIQTTIREHYILNESKVYPFNLNVEEKVYSGVKFNIYNYSFVIDNIHYECTIYPNAWKLKGKDFDVDFKTRGGSTKDIVGKDLNFMNSVLKTVAECIIDFIEKNDVVRKIRFQTSGIREKAYIRFFKSHPHFSKFEIDDSYEHSGFVEINVNKNTE